jgi:hypothetical protein
MFPLIFKWNQQGFAPFLIPTHPTLTLGITLRHLWPPCNESIYLDTQQNPTRGVSHFGLVIYFKKKYLKTKKKGVMETQIFHHAKKVINLPKKLCERNQNPSRYYYYNSIITNLKFQHKPKYHHLSKILI